MEQSGVISKRVQNRRFSAIEKTRCKRAQKGGKSEGKEGEKSQLFYSILRLNFIDIGGDSEVKRVKNWVYFSPTRLISEQKGVLKKGKKRE